MSDPLESRMQEFRETAKKYAAAQANREHLDEFKKSKLAILMKSAEAKGFSSAASQEREARAHPDYLTLLEGLRTAVEQAESLRWELRITEWAIEAWRTKQANMRAERKGYGA